MNFDFLDENPDQMPEKKAKLKQITEKRTNPKKRLQRRYLKLAGGCFLLTILGSITLMELMRNGFDDNHPLTIALCTFLVAPIFLCIFLMLSFACKVYYPRFGRVASIVIEVLIGLVMVIGIISILDAVF